MTEQTNQSSSGDQPDLNGPNMSVQKRFKRYIVYGLAVVAACGVGFLSGKVSTGNDASNHVKEDFTVSGELFSYSKHEDKPERTSEEIQKRLSSMFGKHVYLSKVDGSAVYIAVVNGSMYYVDNTGSILIRDAELYSLDRQEIVSARFESELDYSKQLASARTTSQTSLTSFLGSKEQPTLSQQQTKREGAVSSQSNQIKASHSDAVVHKQAPMQQRQREANEVADVDLNNVLGNMSIENSSGEPINPVLMEMAENLDVNSPKFEDQCITIATGVTDITRQTRLFEAMPEANRTREKCGYVYAQKALPQLPDKQLIVYKAQGEEKAVINIMSDYTCGYCARFHRRIPKLNEAGITVRVFPYGRADYFVRDSTQPTVLASNMAAALCEEPERRSVVFDDLLLNARTYAAKPYPDSTPTDACMSLSIVYKLIGNVFNFTHNTPMVFYDNGIFQYGDALTSADAVIKRALEDNVS